MKNGNKLLIITLLLLFFSGCKKEDMVPPKITIYSPEEGSRYRVGDEIDVKAYVTDDVSINSLTITLLDEKSRVVGASERFEPNKNEFSVEIKYHIADTTLETGTYLLNFKAADSQNETVKTAEIHITGVPKKNLGIFAVTQPAPSRTVIYSIDPDGAFSIWHQLSDDYLFSEMDSKYQRFYLFPRYTGNMQAMNVQTQSTVWSIPRQGSPPSVWFKGIELNDHKLYVSDAYSIVKAYNYRGQIIEQFSALEDFFITKFFFYNNRYFLFQVKNNDVQKRIVALNQGMQPILNILVDFDLVGWYPKDNNTLFLFYNSANGMEIATLYHATGTIHPQKILSGARVHDVEIVGDNKFLLATSQGVLYYNYESGNSLTTLIPESNTTVIEKNMAGTTYVASAGNKIFSFTLPYGNIVQSVYLPDSVCKFHLYYNK